MLGRSITVGHVRQECKRKKKCYRMSLYVAGMDFDTKLPYLWPIWNGAPYGDGEFAASNIPLGFLTFLWRGSGEENIPMTQSLSACSTISVNLLGRCPSRINRAR